MIKRHCSGFTVFEVIMIMTATIVLAAVLYPIMERSKEESKKSACLANMKRCSNGLIMYICDYDACLPTSMSTTDSGAGSPTQAQVIAFLTGIESRPPLSNGRPKSWAQLLSGYAPIDSFICPSDLPGTRLSYWYKYAADLAARDPNINARREADYDHSADQVIFFEHAGWHTGDAAGIRNGVVINVMNLDGHADTITVKNGPTSYPPADDERAGASGIRFGAPMYFNYNYTTNTAHTGVADWIDPRKYGDRY